MEQIPGKWMSVAGDFGAAFHTRSQDVLRIRNANFSDEYVLMVAQLEQAAKRGSADQSLEYLKAVVNVRERLVLPDNATTI